MGDEQEFETATTPPRRRARGARWALGALLAVALVLLGVAGGIMWSERRVSAARVGSGEAGPGAAATGGPALPDRSTGPRSAADAGAGTKEEEPVEVSLTPEAVERAGIKTAPVRSEVSAGTITVPGTVTSDAYRDTKVNALVGGIVRRVGAELGQPVTRGQLLAVIFSSELSDAQMKYLSMQAMLVADHQKLDRTEKLAAIGAASRQELEEISATHHAHETEVAAAKQRLLLLGLTTEQVAALQGASQVVSEVAVAAPSDGVIIARSVNPGQVVGRP